MRIILNAGRRRCQGEGCVAVVADCGRRTSLADVAAARRVHRLLKLLDSD
jgi:hypothetical protein